MLHVFISNASAITNFTKIYTRASHTGMQYPQEHATLCVLTHIGNAALITLSAHKYATLSLTA